MWGKRFPVVFSHSSYGIKAGYFSPLPYSIISLFTRSRLHSFILSLLEYSQLKSHSFPHSKSKVLSCDFISPIPRQMLF